MRDRRAAQEAQNENLNELRREPRDSAGLMVMAGVFLLACSGLLFEIVLTRIFSATIWYHFTFVAISVALFGWGMGGFALELLGIWTKSASRIGLIIGSGLYSAAFPIILTAILSSPFSTQKVELYFLLALIPFLLAGISLSAAFEIFTKDTNRLYFSDLFGASVGTLMVPLLLGLLGAETTVLAIAVLPAVSCVFFILSARRWIPSFAKYIGIAVLAILSILVVLNPKMRFLDIGKAPSNKALYRALAEDPAREIIFDEWNAYSRVTAVSGYNDYRHSRIFIDSDAWTDLSKWDGNIKSLAGKKTVFRFVPFRFHDRPSVLVIGPGGGPDVRLALAAESRKITAVEMNSLIIEYVKAVGAPGGNIYSHPTVHLFLEEGRNFIKRSKSKYDMIILGFVDSWAAVSSGGLSLSENYLYTKEAFKEYYDHLSDIGSLVIMRWPTDVQRCVANSVTVLEDKGLSRIEAGKRILAVSEREPKGLEPVATVFMLRKNPFPKGLSEQILSKFPDAHRIHIPFGESTSPYKELLSGKITLAEYSNRFSQMADPVTDDRPFYFAREKPYGVPAFMTRLLRSPFVAVGVAMLLLIARILTSKTGRGIMAGGIVYFSMLGIGFILVEIALIHKLILLLGHPIHALCVLLFFMLLWSSMGSLAGRRVGDDRIKKVLLCGLPVLVALLALSTFGVPWIVGKALHLNIVVRIAISALMILPFGFCMGIPFPLGLRQVKNSGGSIAMMWGVNGVMSVVGSILAMVIGVAAGFTYVLGVGALSYLIAMVPVCFWRCR